MIIHEGFSHLQDRKLRTIFLNVEFQSWCLKVDIDIFQVWFWRWYLSRRILMLRLMTIFKGWCWHISRLMTISYSRVCGRARDVLGKIARSKFLIVFKTELTESDCYIKDCTRWRTERGIFIAQFLCLSILDFLRNKKNCCSSWVDSCEEQNFL